LAKKFLIGQLGAFGDCLYATTVAKQIKNDFPESHITWAISPKFRSILDLNPHVDEVWEVPSDGQNYTGEAWDAFRKEALKRKQEGLYDELVFTQIPKDNWKNYDGTIRSSILRGYKKGITVSVNPVLHLSDQEVEKVKHFVTANHLNDYKEVVLFECAPGSGQSYVTIDLAIEVAKNILQHFKDVCFVLSTNKALPFAQEGIIDSSSLSFRENAELTKYCTMLIGCSSGITWLSTSDWAKRLKMVQLLSRDYPLFAGVKYDLEYWDEKTDEIIEITQPNIEHIVDCVKKIFDSDFKSAKEIFDEAYRPEYFNFRFILKHLIWNKLFTDIPTVVSAYKKRNKHMNLLTLQFYAWSEVTYFFIYKNLNLVKGKFYTLYQKTLRAKFK
jgi:hypothetical protein